MLICGEFAPHAGKILSPVNLMSCTSALSYLRRVKQMSNFTVDREVLHGRGSGGMKRAAAQRQAARCLKIRAATETSPSSCRQCHQHSCDEQQHSFLTFAPWFSVSKFFEGAECRTSAILFV
jgi:hypothetical protein